MPKISYVDKNFSAQSLSMIERCNGVICRLSVARLFAHVASALLPDGEPQHY